METRLRLGQLLVDACIISQDQLEEVLVAQKQDGRRLGTLLVERGLVNETQLTQILSQQLSVPWVSLYHVDFSRRLLSLVPRDVVEKFCLVPIYVRHVRGQGDTLYVAMDDPTNEEALKACSMWSGLPTRAMIASPSDIRNAANVYYGIPKPDEVAEPGPPPLAETVAPEAIAEAPLNDAPSDDETQASARRDESDTVTEPESPAPQDQEPTVPIVRTRSTTPPTEQDLDAYESAASALLHEPIPRAPIPTLPDVYVEVEAPDAETAPLPPLLVSEPKPAQANEESDAPQEQPMESPAEPDTAQPPSPEPDPAPRPPEPSSIDVTVEVGDAVPIEDLISDRKRAELEAAREVEAARAVDVPPEPQPEPARTGLARSARDKIMSLTLLDGTTLTLPVKRLAKRKATPMARQVEEQQQEYEQQQAEEEEAAKPPSSRPPSSRPRPPSSRPPSSRQPPTSTPPPPLTGMTPSRPPPPPLDADDDGLTARDIVAALRAAAHGVDPSEMLGKQVRWESLMSALLSLMLKKGLIDDQEFIDEFKKL